MGNKCYICGCNPGPFYVWTTSRKFPKKTLIGEMKVTSRSTMKEISVDGKPVCFGCLENLKALNKKHGEI